MKRKGFEKIIIPATKNLQSKELREGERWDANLPSFASSCSRWSGSKFFAFRYISHAPSSTLDTTPVHTCTITDIQTQHIWTKTNTGTNNHGTWEALPYSHNMTQHRSIEEGDVNEQELSKMHSLCSCYEISKTHEHRISKKLIIHLKSKCICTCVTPNEIFA